MILVVFRCIYRCVNEKCVKTWIKDEYTHTGCNPTIHLNSNACTIHVYGLQNLFIAAVKVCSSPVGHKKVGMRGLGDTVRLSSFFIMTGPLD